VAVIAVGCGDDDSAADAAYCSSLLRAQEAFEQYTDVDVIEGGLASIREYVDGIEAALAEVREANVARIGDELDAFRTAFDELLTTLTTGDLPVDRRDEVSAARDEVERTWDELRAAAEIDCGDIG
jgi:hypothetical protein